MLLDGLEMPLVGISLMKRRVRLRIASRAEAYTPVTVLRQHEMSIAKEKEHIAQLACFAKETVQRPKAVSEQGHHGLPEFWQWPNF